MPHLWRLCHTESVYRRWWIRHNLPIKSPGTSRIRSICYVRLDFQQYEPDVMEAHGAHWTLKSYSHLRKIHFWRPLQQAWYLLPHHQKQRPWPCYRNSYSGLLRHELKAIYAWTAHKSTILQRPSRTSCNPRRLRIHDHTRILEPLRIKRKPCNGK